MTSVIYFKTHQIELLIIATEKKYFVFIRHTVQLSSFTFCNEKFGCWHTSTIKIYIWFCSAEIGDRNGKIHLNNRIIV